MCFLFVCVNIYKKMVEQQVELKSYFTTVEERLRELEHATFIAQQLQQTTHTPRHTRSPPKTTTTMTMSTPGQIVDLSTEPINSQSVSEPEPNSPCGSEERSKEMAGNSVLREQMKKAVGEVRPHHTLRRKHLMKNHLILSMITCMVG